MTILSICTEFPNDRKKFVEYIQYLKCDKHATWHNIDLEEKLKCIGLLLKSINRASQYEWLVDHRNSEDFITVLAGSLIDMNEPAIKERNCHNVLAAMALDWFNDAMVELLESDDI